ncbi:MAG: flagellar basal body rod C-terminal domain-containing protein [Pseudomonadota bacterium]
MSDILAIGKSGLLAARMGLETTSQNIANANTPGYLRRELMTRENLSSDGVEVRDIRRAFDALLSARLREASSSQGAADAFQIHARELENLMLPETNGIEDALDTFFDGLDAMVLDPGDDSLRQAFYENGQSFAARVRDLAGDLDAREADIETQRDLAASQANDILEALANIEDRLANVTTASDRNPLLDLRDQKLTELAELVPINTETDEADRLTVRLGSDGGGTVLMTLGEAGRIEAQPDGRIAAFAAGNPGTATTWTPTSGVLGGLSDAAVILSDARDGLDAWTAEVTAQMNAVHAQGVTPGGAPGGTLFQTSGWQATPGALTRGSGVADVVITDEAAMPAGPITLIRDEGTALWSAVDGGGTVLATGGTSLSLPGLSITIGGVPSDGDRITLTREDVDAGAFRLALNDPDDFASGGRFLVTPDPTNPGSAGLLVTGTPPATAQEVRVTDAALGEIGFFDPSTGTQIGTATLDAAGRATFGGYEIGFDGPLTTGDSFLVEANAGTVGDGRVTTALADLRVTNLDTGVGGFAASFTELRIAAGANVVSADARLSSAATSMESAQQAVSARGGVDLDEEAARLIAQQQAYQANAQVINVARDIFNTLLGSL